MDLAPLMLIGALGGALLPEMVLRQRAGRRLRRIARRLPDALDLLIIFANAGYAMDQAIQRLTVELRRGAADLCDELAVTSNELRGLSDRQQALQNFADRTGLEQVQSLVSTLAQAHKYGTPLSQALRVLAAEERNRRIAELEERAGRMAVLITLPVVGLILPGTLLMLMAPALLPNSHEISGLLHNGMRP
jgi:tight adherence protein C